MPNGFPGGTENVRVTVDRELCMGFGRCLEIAPDVFDLDDDGISTVIGPPTDEKAVVDAEWSCPRQAITVTSTAVGGIPRRMNGS